MSRPPVVLMDMQRQSPTASANYLAATMKCSTSVLMVLFGEEDLSCLQVRGKEVNPMASKVKALPYKEHDLCRATHMLILITQPDGTRYPIESCGKINFYLAMMRQKYGWKTETIGEYNEESLKLLLKDLEEQDAEQHKAEDGKDEAGSSSTPGA